ncbi:MAG TPA: hypothetical protein VM290_09130 [Gaiellaceae bacterium]|nr:hypothetical protein [Gaiellaceae bacterium]
MEPRPRQTFHPLAAGGILTGTTGAGIAVGAGIGWALGSWPLGALGGAVVGVPAGVAAVYRRYRGAFS